MEATIGGTKRHLFDLATSFDPASVQVEVACPPVRSEAHGDTSFAGDLHEAGVTVRRIPMVRAIRPWADATTIVRLARLIRRGGYDIVHTHSTKAGITGRLAARWDGVRTVHTPHGFYYLNFAGGIGRAMARWLEKALGAMTDRVIALSDGEHREAMKLLGASRVRLVPNGFEPFEALPKTEARRRLGLSPDVPVVGTTSRFTAQKAPMDIVEAFRVIHAARPDARLLWINGGELQTVVEQRLADLGLLHATLRPGFVPDARTLLPAMDVYLHLARWEGVPYAVMEAMWAGVPVVGAEAIGTSDLIAHGDTGLLVGAGDGAAAGGAALRVLTEPALARTIAQAAACGMRRRQDRHGMARATEAVYRELMQTD